MGKQMVFALILIVVLSCACGFMVNVPKKSDKKVAYRITPGSVIGSGNIVDGREIDLSKPDAIVDGYYVWYQKDEE